MAIKANWSIVALSVALESLADSLLTPAWVRSPALPFSHCCSMGCDGMGWLRDRGLSLWRAEQKGLARAELFIYMAQLEFSVIGSQSVSQSVIWEMLLQRVSHLSAHFWHYAHSHDLLFWSQGCKYCPQHMECCLKIKYLLEDVLNKLLRSFLFNKYWMITFYQRFDNNLAHIFLCLSHNFSTSFSHCMMSWL